MYKKIFILFLIVSFMLIVCPAYAQTTVDYEQIGSKLQISGITDGYGAVFIDIFRKDPFIEGDTFKSSLAYSALESAVDKAEVLLYTDQTEINDNSFDFDVRIVRYPGITGDLSGLYVAVIHLDSGVIEKEMLFVDSAETDSTLEKLSLLRSQDETTRKSEVFALIKENKFTLGIYTDNFDSLSDELFDDMIYNKTEEYAYNFTEKEEFISELKRIVAISTLNDGKMASVDMFKEELGITKEKYSEWYEKKYVNDAFKSSLTKRLSGKKLNDATFDYSLGEALVLTTVEKADGIADVKGVINAFKGEYNNKKNYSDGAFRSVMGNHYASYSELFKALDSYNSDSGGGKGGGGVSPGKNVNTEATFPIVSIAPIVEINTEFKDVPRSHWAADAVYTLKDMGIVSGKSLESFAPDDNITREEFVKLIIEFIGVEPRTGTSYFTDAVADAWYMPYLDTAYSLGIVKGSDDGSFGIGRPITRQDIAVMFNRALEYQSVEIPRVKEKVTFTDQDAASDYAKEALEKFQLAGIINGYSDGSLKPFAVSTRAEAAQIVFNAMNILK